MARIHSRWEILYGAGWALVVFDRGEAIRQAYVDARSQRRWVAAAITLLCLGLWAALHFGFAARLARLAQAVRDFGDGRTNSLPAIPGGDEVNKLSVAFATMGARLAEREAERVRLERVVLDTSEREQRRIGEDLHDGLGQQLTAAALATNGLITALGSAAPALVSQAEHLSRQLREAIAEVRTLSHGLAPVPLAEDGLMHALHELAEVTMRSSGVRCIFDCPQPVSVPDVVLAGHLYRIAQEAVNNALKHAAANEIRLGLERRGDALVLEVEDDGEGLPETSAFGRWRGPRLDAAPGEAHCRPPGNRITAGGRHPRGLLYSHHHHHMSQQKPSKGAAPGPSYRILLVDDHPVVLDGYKLMLNAQPDFVVCATAPHAADALRAVERERPDLVLTDLNMPDRGGLELIKDLAVLHPSLKVLVCSMHDEMLYAERALHAGAKGYLTKDSPGPVMIAAIRRVLEGGIYVSERLAARVLDAFAEARPRGSSSPLEKLSDREFEVFRLFGEGRTAKEIAAQLNLSPKTVSVHRDHIKQKMEFATSAEMIRQAVRWVETERLEGK